MPSEPPGPILSLVKSGLRPAGYAAAVAAVAVVAVFAMRPGPPSRWRGAQAGPSAAVLPLVTHDRRRGGLDVTFMVAADTHVGFAASEKTGEGGLRDPVLLPAASDRHNSRQIEAMNALPGQPFPVEIGGNIGTPRGVLIAGDLTEDGEPWQWNHFVRWYGLRGGDGQLRWPVFETHGNHDKHHSWYTLDRIRERHGGTRYAFDWDDLRVVCLGEAPDEEGLAFLERNLSAVGKERPVVLYFHFPLRGPFSTGNWFGDGRYAADLARVVFGYNVVAVFHGHYHGSGRYRWEGIDVYNVGSTKHEQWSFGVVRVTDKRLSVASWHYDKRHWEFWHDKPINGDRGAEREGGAREDRGLYLGR